MPENVTMFFADIFFKTPSLHKYLISIIYSGRHTWKFAGRNGMTRTDWTMNSLSGKTKRRMKTVE